MIAASVFDELVAKGATRDQVIAFARAGWPDLAPAIDALALTGGTIETIAAVIRQHAQNRDAADLLQRKRDRDADRKRRKRAGTREMNFSPHASADKSDKTDAADTASANVTSLSSKRVDDDEEGDAREASEKIQPERVANQIIDQVEQIVASDNKLPKGGWNRARALEDFKLLKNQSISPQFIVDETRAVSGRAPGVIESFLYIARSVAKAHREAATQRNLPLLITIPGGSSNERHHVEIGQRRKFQNDRRPGGLYRLAARLEARTDRDPDMG